MNAKWLTVPEYMELTGLSRIMIYKLIEEEKIIYIETDSGQKKIKVENNHEVDELSKKTDELTKLLKDLCKHLGLTLE